MQLFDQVRGEWGKIGGPIPVYQEGKEGLSLPQEDLLKNSDSNAWWTNRGPHMYGPARDLKSPKRSLSSENAVSRIADAGLCIIHGLWSAA